MNETLLNESMFNMLFFSLPFLFLRFLMFSVTVVPRLGSEAFITAWRAACAAGSAALPASAPRWRPPGLADSAVALGSWQGALLSTSCTLSPCWRRVCCGP